MWTSTPWSRTFFALILTSWVCVLLGGGMLNAQHTAYGQNKGAQSNQHQAAAPPPAPVNPQTKPAPVSQQTKAAEEEFRKRTLQIAEEQVKISRKQSEIAAQQNGILSKQVGIYQGLLVVAAFELLVLIVQVIALVRTLGVTNRSSAAAETAADAARDSADALANAERPHLLIENTPTMTTTGARLDPRLVWTESFVRNYGRSPAWIVGTRIRFEAVAALPGNPPSDGILPWEGAYVIPPGERLPIGRRLDPDGSLTFAEHTRVQDGSLHLFFHGLIDYTDTSGNPHRSRFAWQHDPKGKVPFTPFPARAYWEYT